MKPSLSYRSVHRFPDTEAWAISPHGDVIAIAVKRVDGAEIQIRFLTSSHVVASKVLVSGSDSLINLTWSTSGRYLAVCAAPTVTVLEFKVTSHSLSEKWRFAATWNHAIFSGNEKTLFGSSTDASGKISLYTTSLAGPTPRPVTVKNRSVTEWNCNTTFLSFDDARVLLIGAGLTLGADGGYAPSIRMGNTGIYDLVAGTDSFDGKPFALHVEQPVAPKGKRAIMVVRHTNVFAESLDGKCAIRLPWRRSERIEAIQASTSHRVFVQLYRDNSNGSLILHEYLLSL